MPSNLSLPTVRPRFPGGGAERGLISLGVAGGVGSWNGSRRPSSLDGCSTWERGLAAVAELTGGICDESFSNPPDPAWARPAELPTIKISTRSNGLNVLSNEIDKP